MAAMGSKRLCVLRVPFASFALPVFSRETDMAEYRFCTFADEGRVRIVTINRPEVMNALHSEAHWEFD